MSAPLLHRVLASNRDIAIDYINGDPSKEGNVQTFGLLKQRIFFLKLRPKKLFFTSNRKRQRTLLALKLQDPSTVLSAPRIYSSIS